MADAPPPLPRWPHAGSPFHPAELELQERLGWRAPLDEAARRGIRGVLVDQHRSFFAQIPFVLVGSVDATGQPWASILAGEPGFVHSPLPSQLRFDTHPQAGDPLKENLSLGNPLGVLGIELHTRRRNRMSGLIAAVDEVGFTVAVVQSYGNCPQYIQSRVLRPPLEGTAPSSVARAERLSVRDRELIERADSFYIASSNPNSEDGARGGTDVSHRGGRPGFIRVDDDRTITTPDFVGNYFFNTIGNLMVEPRAGLLFADFETGDLLLAAARAEVIWEGPEVEAFAGAQRLLRFHLTQLIRIERGLPFRSDGVEYARELARTGTWAEAAQALKAKADASTWRPYRIAGSSSEGDGVRSFILEPADGGGVAPYRAGQFLPIRLPAGPRGASVLRTYTLSDAADGHRYRITVKREGAASRWLHEHGHAGTVIEALAPRGEFVFDEASQRPALMISAGIGVTPMVAMVNSLLVNDRRTRHPWPIVFIQGARNGREQPFAAHLRQKARMHSNLWLHVAYSAPTAADALGISHDSEGRIDTALLKRLLPPGEPDVYLCGPTAFMQDQYDSLRQLGVSDERIHCEAFGPSTLRRSRTGPAARPRQSTVTFARSGISIPWSPESGSLLEAAESAGIRAASSCRSGVCGTCATGLRSGKVIYAQEPVAPCGSGEVLLCCARPNPADLSVPVVLEL